MSDIWVHNEIREEVLFCFKRITEQTEYIREIRMSDRTPKRKEEIIESAKFIKNQFKERINQYMQKGLIGVDLNINS